MDDDGNRTSVVTTPYGQSAATVSYTANSLSQYTAVGGASPTHDANGNVLDNGVYKFKYNYRNLICEARLSSNNNLVATHAYDSLGRRVGKVVSGGATTRFVLSGLETVETYDGANNWKQTFLFGQDLDDILVLEQADVLDYDADTNTSETTRSFYHRNAVGSVTVMTDVNNGQVCHLRYEPFGDRIITRGGSLQSSDPLAQNLAFTARAFDEETSTYYYRARYYASEWGRFLARDPCGV